ncbi:Protein of uncharacterised function (DUF692) [Legionella pneumophila]|uniref:DUF692 domain-containing protein n=1 Tax=Legionella pneumophila subsp. pneumophila TaxID=91891 RepID=A0AAV2UV46_LEGPN|nr:DUF692 domain-containing protein [Legionella pneumophila]AMV13431.1 hypothetical protein ULM_07450 [Legionella pneumophila]ANN91754.1 hypothetical protein A9P85_03625 [Legionella pneumophila]MCZ4678407.1 DUF692 domain-containing protein [Legionella pneumophila]MCZ4703844.1 DUF692 domain-containing protein [Legionella pneumophila]MCZ4750181.1 DUF692 domain-containing protein [Legionella pneumophila]
MHKIINGAMTGIGLRAPHYAQILEEKPDIDWLEVHTENFLVKGGPLLELLDSISQHYPLSFHGVGLSLGSAEGVCIAHLNRIKTLIDRFQPPLLSDHLSWSTIGNTYLPDLLPIPYNEESLTIISNNIDRVQNYLKRTLLIENPSSYLEYQTSSYSEPDFLAEIIKRTEARLLLDINNIYVSCSNNKQDPYQYIQRIPHEAVQEIHLAGHSIVYQDNTNFLRIDTHNNYVCHEVWDLYRYAIHYTGLVPTLLEWDTEIPSLDTLLNEARKSACYA